MALSAKVHLETLHNRYNTPRKSDRFVMIESQVMRRLLSVISPIMYCSYSKAKKNEFKEITNLFYGRLFNVNCKAIKNMINNSRCFQVVGLERIALHYEMSIFLFKLLSHCKRLEE